MHLIRSLLSGPNRHFTLIRSAVPNANYYLPRQNEFGLIDEHPYLPKIIAANYRSFTNVNVVLLGGHGVAIALPTIGSNLIL